MERPIGYLMVNRMGLRTPVFVIQEGEVHSPPSPRQQYDDMVSPPLPSEASVTFCRYMEKIQAQGPSIPIALRYWYAIVCTLQAISTLLLRN